MANDCVITKIEKYIEQLVSLREFSKRIGQEADIESLTAAIAALVEKKEREENEQLTIEELRKMDGEPVWVVCEQCLKNGAAWCILEPCEKNFVVLVSRDENRFGRFGGMWDDYGKSWIAYRYKKENNV